MTCSEVVAKLHHRLLRMFSHLVAENSQRSIAATEQDEKTLRWTMRNRSRENIPYCKKALSQFNTDEFEVAVESIA